MSSSAQISGIHFSFVGTGSARVKTCGGLGDGRKDFLGTKLDMYTAGRKNVAGMPMERIYSSTSALESK